jgi:hypothetical protein
VFINETNISNQFEREFNFIRSKDYLSTQWLDVVNEHFIIWMKTEVYPTFRKIWGRVDQKLFAGDYTIVVKSSKKKL